MLRYEELEGTPLYRRDVDVETVRYFIPRDHLGHVVSVGEANRLECYALESSSWALHGRPWCRSDELLSIPVSPKEWDSSVVVRYRDKFSPVVNILGHVTPLLGTFNGRLTRLPKGDYSIFKGAGGIRLYPL